MNQWMDKENVVHIYLYNGLFNHKEEWNYVICKKIDGVRNYHLKPQSKRQISYAEYAYDKEKGMKVKGEVFGGWYQWEERDK
jgi:hypothetical protein